MAKKRLLSILMLSICILSLAGCKKANEEPEILPDDYAINEVKNKTTEADEDSIVDEYGNIKNELTELDYTTEDTTQTDASIDNIVYVYPNTDSGVFYADSIPFGSVCQYGFIINDIEANSNLGNTAETSIQKHIYSQGYNYPLILTNVETDTKNNTYSLAKASPLIESITIGNDTYESIDDFIVPTTEFESTIKSYESKYSVIYTKEDENGNSVQMSYDKNNIFSYAYSEDNKYSGLTYTWYFSLNTYDNEYTDEEKEYVSGTPNDQLKVIAVYDKNNEIISYTYKLNLMSHRWSASHIEKIIVYDYYLDEDGELVRGDPIGEDELDTGIVNTFTDGFDYNFANIKLKDGSYVGLDNFSITIYNPDSNSNSNQTFTYTIN